jgi:hypothetical protein
MVGREVGYAVGARECVSFFFVAVYGAVLTSLRYLIDVQYFLSLEGKKKKEKRIAIKEGKNKETHCFVQITSFAATNGTEEEVK